MIPMAIVQYRIGKLPIDLVVEPLTLEGASDRYAWSFASLQNHGWALSSNTIKDFICFEVVNWFHSPKSVEDFLNEISTKLDAKMYSIYRWTRRPSKTQIQIKIW